MLELNTSLSGCWPVTHHVSKGLQAVTKFAPGIGLLSISYCPAKTINASQAWALYGVASLRSSPAACFNKQVCAEHFVSQ